MNNGDNRATIEDLDKRVRSLEERVDSCLGFNWASLRPAQGGGFEVPADEAEVRALAVDLGSKRSDVTDVMKLHMVDMMLHFFSLWPVLPPAGRRYAFNMGTLLVVALTEGWNEASQRSNGFGPQLVAPALNGHQTPVARSSMPPQVNGVQTTPVAGTSALTMGGTPAVEPASLHAAVASPLRPTPRSPPGTPLKRESVDEAVGATPPKVASSCAGTSCASTPLSPGQSPGNPQDASPLSYKPKCKCKQPAYRLQVRKDNQNHGRYFYKCFKSAVANPISPCAYFEWEDQMPAKAPKNCSHCQKPGHNKNNCPAK